MCVLLPRLFGWGCDMVVMSTCLYCRLISAVKMRQFEHEQLEQQRQACQLTAEVQPLWGSSADSGASKKRDGESNVATVQPEPEQQQEEEQLEKQSTTCASGAGYLSGESMRYDCPSRHMQE